MFASPRDHDGCRAGGFRDVSSRQRQPRTNPKAGSQRLLAVAELSGRCLATSGDYATAFSPDRRFNHLFDPRTGKSPRGLISVSVVAPSAMEADALSTACFVLGLKRATTFIESRKDCDAFFVASDGSTTKTAGFPLKQGEVG